MSEPVRRYEPAVSRAAPRRVKRVLLVGLKQAPIERLLPALKRGAFEVVPARTGPSALVACRQRRFDLLLVREPIAELALEDLLEGVRASDNLSSRAFVLVLTEESRVEELAPLVGERFDVSYWADFPHLLAVVSRQALGVAPRVSEHFMAEVRTQLAGGTVSRFHQVGNISETGLLVETRDLISIGGRVVLSFSLPGVSQSVRVSGEVVRHTERTEPDGFAVRFDEFAGVSFRRLRAFLNS